MKLFIRKFFLFSFLSVFLVVLYENSLSFVPNTYTLKKKLVEENKEHIQMIVLGTSRAFSGIMPNKMNDFTVNIGNNSQSIYYDIELLNPSLWKI